MRMVWQMDRRTERREGGRTDGRTEMTKLIVATRKFSNEAKNPREGIS
jgi:hypothetical protein